VIEKAIVTLTFDDALDSQLDEALPRLDAAGLRATFFVNVNAPSLGRRAHEWRRVGETGHELGNHSLLHPGRAHKPWTVPGCRLEDYTLERMRVELQTANRVLQALDGRDRRTFAFPSSDPMVGRAGLVRWAQRRLGLERTRVGAWVKRRRFDPGSRRRDYTPVIRELFPAARCGSTGHPLPPSALADRHRVPALVGDDRAEAQLLGLVDEAIERTAWAVFVFHGVGGGRDRFCAAETFGALVRRLAEDDRISVMTFLDAADSIWPEAPAS